MHDMRKMNYLIRKLGKLTKKSRAESENVRKGVILLNVDYFSISLFY